MVRTNAIVREFVWRIVRHNLHPNLTSRQIFFEYGLTNRVVNTGGDNNRIEGKNTIDRLIDRGYGTVIGSDAKKITVER